MERFLISSEHIRAPGQPESRVKISCTRGDALCGTKGSQDVFRVRIGGQSADLRVSLGSSEKLGGWQCIQRDPQSRQAAPRQP